MPKDFTVLQADQWVVQELAKCPTPESVRARLTTEEQTLRLAEQHGLTGKFPNSERARRDLIAALREAAK